LSLGSKAAARIDASTSCERRDHSGINVSASCDESTGVAMNSAIGVPHEWSIMDTSIESSLSTCSEARAERRRKRSDRLDEKTRRLARILRMDVWIVCVCIHVCIHTYRHTYNEICLIYAFYELSSDKLWVRYRLVSWWCSIYTATIGQWKEK
jgi:hypothetical protein